LLMGLLMSALPRFEQANAGDADAGLADDGGGARSRHQDHAANNAGDGLNGPRYGRIKVHGGASKKLG
jgi:hypothetical protein